MFSVVIPVAGWGTRSLPASKSIPKEMLPVYDRPIVQYVAEEAAEAGAQNLVFVTSKGKTAIEDHFDISADLEAVLKTGNKTKLLEIVQDLSRKFQVQSVRQKQMLGLGHAVLMAKDMVQTSPFGVALGDDIIEGNPAGLKQLMNVYQTLPTQVRENAGVILLMEVPDTEVSKYGICEMEAGNSTRVVRCIEKPKPEQTKSRLAIIGRYLLPKKIFYFLETQKPGALGEIQLTDGLNQLAAEGNLYGCVLKGERFDAGDRLGFLKANIHYYLKSELAEETMKLLRSFLK